MKLIIIIYDADRDITVWVLNKSQKLFEGICKVGMGFNAAIVQL